MAHKAFAQFNIQVGDELTWNVRPILHEVRHALKKLVESGESSIIDLRSIPLAPGEESRIIDALGCGEVHVKLNVLGPSEVYETRYKGVWLVTHFNEDNSIVGRFIEVTLIPDIIKSQDEDIRDSLDELESMLASDNNETKAETTHEEGVTPRA